MVPQLWRHMAACDLAVVQGGGTTTLEVEALRVPFLFFPVEHHSEQEVTIANRLARHGAGVRMHVLSTSPKDMADAIAATLGVPVSYAEIPVGEYSSALESAMWSPTRQGLVNALGG
jgi:UDP-N-acetylglucosamine:LPS N-acetylglucosamine transferase